MAVIDRDIELLSREVSRILDQHRAWLKPKLVEESIWETLNASTRVYDRILNLCFPALAVGMKDHICLVALGSFGREEVCPHSDLDLLILYQGLPHRKIENFSARLLGLLWDQKIKVGHSLRTKEECLKLAEKDHSVLTALLDARPVAGNFALFEKLTAGFEKKIKSLRKAFFLAKHQELSARWAKFKNVIWITEPQIMEGVGGLRDWHHIRWFSRACLGMKAPEELARIGLATEPELEKIRLALARLFKVRAGLHLLTGEKNDLMQIELQDQLANFLGIKSDNYQDPGDALLEWTFAGSETVLELLDRLLFLLNDQFKKPKPKPIEGPSWLEQTQGCLSIKDAGFARKLESDPELAVRLFMAVAQSGLPLAPRSRTLISEKREPIGSRLGQRIMDLFGPGLKTSLVIKELKRVGLVKQLFPELERSFYLGQRDGYHSYTVGWHSILCLSRIERMEQEPEFGDDPEINWPILKLAGLVHDLGKGSGGDHQVQGAQIGLELAQKFYLDAASSELLKFLIANHLLLNHYAFRRDFYEPRAVEFLVREIKESARLKMLFILTAADIQAVSDVSWTNWKDDLLRRIYHLLLAHLERKETPSKQLSDRLRELKNLSAGKNIPEEWIKDLEKLPTRYLLGTPPEKIIDELMMVEQRKPGEISIRIRKLEKPRLEVIVVCDDHPGLFSELSGAMSALNYNILSAEINTINATVLDIFVVEDLVADKSAEWGPEIEPRNLKLDQTLTQALQKKISVPELVAKKKGIFKPRTRLQIPVEVHFDQESSEQYTIIEVQAPDQTGLLYKITRAIYEHGLDIQFAKISTRAEKVFDVFYLRDPKAKGKADDEKISKLVKSLQISLKSNTESG